MERGSHNETAQSNNDTLRKPLRKPLHQHISKKEKGPVGEPQQDMAPRVLFQNIMYIVFTAVVTAEFTVAQYNTKQYNTVQR